MEPIKAKVPKADDRRNNAVNHGGQKELLDAWSALVIHKGKIREVACCRSYMGKSRTASVRYASIWINLKGGYRTSGTGKAGGYGYCKRSAAVDEAIASAGVKLSQSIAGVGDMAIEEALKAIVRGCGYRGEPVIVFH